MCGNYWVFMTNNVINTGNFFIFRKTVRVFFYFSNYAFFYSLTISLITFVIKFGPLLHYNINSSKSFLLHSVVNV